MTRKVQARLVFARGVNSRQLIQQDLGLAIGKAVVALSPEPEESRDARQGH
jgi:hypothetical protein